MKYWKWLAWLCTALFLVLLIFSWVAQHNTDKPALEQPNDPPPAPVFR